MNETDVLKFAYECLKASIRLLMVMTLPSRYFEDPVMANKLCNYIIAGELPNSSSSLDTKEDES